jgi:acetyltransferase-like isoleucine patch superfamily enzyme
MISESAVIYPNVKLGENCVVEDFVILGKPPRGFREGEVDTVIGNNAVIRSHTVIYAGNKIGNNFSTGHHVMIREMNIIGNKVSIGTGTVLEHHVNLGNDVRIHSQAFIPEFTTVEEGAWIGPRVTITNARYPRSPGVKDALAGAQIKKHAKIGANSTLLPGVVLGENCLIGAGSVVTKDVAAGKVMAGNPARIINDISDLPYGSSGE